jgi:UDP-N-acetylglucosamine--N-acetylmuramyl-(pentapeptide) pyrophosphoryl-undecaprenol N-acetylglucosamine transferase
MRLVVSGGGTGGHVYPAIAIARSFMTLPGNEIVFVGSTTGLEGKAARDAGIKFEGLELAGVVGKGPTAALRAILLFARATLRCRRLFKDMRPGCVVGTGGYAAAPACFAAAWMKLPLVLHEMNFKPGLVTRLLSRRAGAVAVAFEGTAGLLGRGARVRVTGVPVRAEIEALAGSGPRSRAREEALEQFGLEDGRRTLLVFGGSQGAQAINNATFEALPKIAERGDIQVLHLTGSGGYGDPRRLTLEESLNAPGLLYKAIEYCDRMELAYSIADLALVRAGAGTIAEITAAGVPALLVPYPYATGHQELNARELEVRGAVRVVVQDGESASCGFTSALLLLDDRVGLERMKEAMRSLRGVTGTEGIAVLVEELT